MRKFSQLVEKVQFWTSLMADQYFPRLGCWRTNSEFWIFATSYLVSYLVSKLTLSYLLCNVWQIFVLDIYHFSVWWLRVNFHKNYMRIGKNNIIWKATKVGSDNLSDLVLIPYYSFLSCAEKSESDWSRSHQQCKAEVPRLFLSREIQTHDTLPTRESYPHSNLKCNCQYC